MRTAKVAISLEKELLEKLDFMVRNQLFPSRSYAIQIALKEKLKKMEANRLALECAKLDPKFEQELAEEGFAQDIEEWPKY